MKKGGGRKDTGSFPPPLVCVVAGHRRVTHGHGCHRKNDEDITFSESAGGILKSANGKVYDFNVDSVLRLGYFRIGAPYLSVSLPDCVLALSSG